MLARQNGSFGTLQKGACQHFRWFYFFVFSQNSFWNSPRRALIFHKCKVKVTHQKRCVKFKAEWKNVYDYLLFQFFFFVSLSFYLFFEVDIELKLWMSLIRQSGNWITKNIETKSIFRIENCRKFTNAHEKCFLHSTNAIIFETIAFDSSVSCDIFTNSSTRRTQRARSKNERMKSFIQFFFQFHFHIQQKFCREKKK